MAAATANSNEGDEMRSKTQQSPLASQRAKAEGNKSGGYFTLGYKEGFSQWVCKDSHCGVCVERG